MQVPKISLKWLLPVFLTFILVTSFISYDLENEQPELQFDDSDAPLERPDYLISKNQLPGDWKFGLEMNIKERYYLQVKTNQPKSFSVETIEFNSSSDARNFVQQSKSNIQNTGLQVSFYEEEPKVELHGVNDGYNWEIKSPCCYSRGVAFSVDNYYIYIFGSQESQWEDIDLLFTQQAIKIFDYIGAEIPPELIDDGSSFNPVFAGIGAFVLLVVGFAGYRYWKVKS